MNPDKMLLDMLMTKRPAWSMTEEIFIEKYLQPLPGFYQDDFGNVIIQVGEDDPEILWSSHTDTVHSDEGKQGIIITGPIITADTGPKREKTNCLGADCTSGVWLMVKMIEADIPGLYIFHRAEENGGLGSKWIAKNTPEVLRGINYAIAFDRKGYDSVITHQRGSRCCSADFADSLAGILGNNFKADKTGVFTDTASYVDLIGECTNISVGYFSQHGPMENQNWIFLNMLLETMIEADFSTLIQRRMPGDPDPDKPVYNYKPYRGGYVPYGQVIPDDDEPWHLRSDYASATKRPLSLSDYCYEYSDTVSRYLDSFGITVEDLQEFRREELAAVTNNSR